MLFAIMTFAILLTFGKYVTKSTTSKFIYSLKNKIIMKELYFVNLIGNLNIAAWVIFSVLCFAAFLIGIAYFMEDIDKLQAKKLLKSMTIVAAICILAGILVPTKKDLYMIYGVGSVIDYVQESDEAKQLPEKTIKMLNALADKYTPEETKESEK